MEAKYFIFSVVKGSVELRVVEKRNGFSGWVLLKACCVAWLLLMLEEVLQNPEGGVVVYPKVVQDARSCFHTMGVSFKGTDKGFLDFLTKGKREVKNLECSINFDARGVGFSQIRGKRLGV